MKGESDCFSVISRAFEERFLKKIPSSNRGCEVKFMLKTYLLPAEELQSNYHTDRNDATVELLIGLSWNAEQTAYLYFFRLNQITLGTLCVYRIVPNTLECLQ